MSKQQNGVSFSPLTPEQKALLEKQAISSNPLDRLKTNFYEQTRHGLLEDYYSTVKDITDEDELTEAREVFLNACATLRKDQAKDLFLLQQIFFDDAGIAVIHHELLIP